MWRLRQLLIGVACAGLLITAGCTDDSSGASTDPSPSASSSGEPSPSEPTTQPTWTPPPAQKPPKGGWPEDRPATEINAEKVVRLWIDAYSRARVTGDTSRMRRFGTSKCSQCRLYAREIEQDFINGDALTFRGRPYLPGKLTYIDSESKQVELRMIVHSAAGTRTSIGKNPVKFAAVDYEWFFLMSTDRSLRWRISRTGFMG